MPPAPPGLPIADFATPLDDAGGGLAAFAARFADGRDGAMALLVDPRRPPRPLPMAALSAAPIPGVLCPIGHALVARVADGPAEPVVFCQRPSGPSLARPGKPWTDAALLAEVLRPVARALELLQGAGITHRAIFPANLFRTTPQGGLTVLGSAWAAPPASTQPSLFLSPESAMCVPCGRGDGTPADDVYALGVSLALLATGCSGTGPPGLAGLDDEAIILRKLDRGSAATVLDGARLSPLMTALVRSMLAEDPDHRPTPAKLLDLDAVANRQIAVRPARRAAQPLRIGPIAAIDTRSLAFALARAPDAARTALENGSVALWLRRGLLDVTLAGRLEDVVVNTRSSANTDPATAARVRTMAAIATLDSHAPLCWGGIAVAPDGIASALAAATPDQAPSLIDLIRDEGVSSFCSVRSGHPDAAPWRALARRLRSWLAIPGWMGGVDRLRLAANPLLGLSAAETAGLGAILTPADLLVALDRHGASAALDRSGTSPLTPRLAAFLAARLEARFQTQVEAVAEFGSAGRAGELELFARLQRHFDAGPLPGLAAWLADRAAPLLDGFRDAVRRAALRDVIAKCVRDGDLDTMHAALTDPVARAADALAASAAAARIAQIEARLATLQGVSAARTDRARRIGQEVASGVGLGALSLALVMAALR